MGNKKSKESNPEGEEETDGITTNNQKVIEGSKAKKGEQKIDQAKREAALIDLVMKEKNLVLKTGIQIKAKQNMDKGLNKQAWEAVERIRFDEETSIELISYDLSNSKVYEMLCNNLRNAGCLKQLILVNCNLNNFLRFLPEQLEKLDLRENLISSISFDSQTEIIYLDVSSNRLTGVPENLPQTVTYLLLQNNLIREASKESFEELNSLQTLNLSGNQIEKVNFTTKIFTCLYDLNLSFNKIQTLPENFFYPSKTLVTLSLSNNPLVKLEANIGEMQTLQRLDLRATKLNTLPPSVSLLNRLEKLLIENVFLTDPPMYVAKKGIEAIMKYLKDKYSKMANKIEKVNQDSQEGNIDKTEDEKDEGNEENIEKEEGKDDKTDRTSMPLATFKKNNSTNESLKLKREEFAEVAEWLENDELSSNDYKIFKDFLFGILNDSEIDIDKIFFTINAVSKVFLQYLEDVKSGSKVFELSASSSYFLGRIGEYPKAVNFLNEIGFKLVSKPFVGLMMTLKSNQETYKKMKQHHYLLEHLLKMLKQCRMKEQFVPDYRYRRNK